MFLVQPLTNRVQLALEFRSPVGPQDLYKTISTGGYQTENLLKCTCRPIPSTSKCSPDPIEEYGHTKIGDLLQKCVGVHRMSRTPGISNE